MSEKHVLGSSNHHDDSKFRLVIVRRFAFVMTKRGHEDAAGRMLGPAALKVRILRKLGYRDQLYKIGLPGKLIPC